MKNKEKSITIRLTQEDFDKLQKIANQEYRSVTSLVRLLIINLNDGNISLGSEGEKVRNTPTKRLHGNLCEKCKGKKTIETKGLHKWCDACGGTGVA